MDSNLLGEDRLLQSLLINSNPEGEDALLGHQAGMNTPQQLHKVVIPKPGFCVKLKNDTSIEKFFINVCQADNLPEPREISDEELLKLLDSDDPTGFRVPMSIGEAHAELDNAGKGCTAYDIVVHPTFLVRMQNSDVMLGFFLTIVMQGLEAKYDLTLDRKWKILKNKKFIGTLPEQNIRMQSKPLIQDMSGNLLSGKPSLISEISTEESLSDRPKAPQPPYTIIQEPSIGYPDFLVAEMHLPKVKLAASITVDIGEDRILLQTRSNIYHLDIYLPYNVVQDESAAQYNKNTKILTLTMPVAPR